MKYCKKLTALHLFLPQSNAEICFNELSTVPGLNPIMPSGAMYLMVSTAPVAQPNMLYVVIKCAGMQGVLTAGLSFHKAPSE